MGILTQEALDARRAALQSDLQKSLAQVQEMEQRVYRLQGALIDCDHWQEALDAESKAPGGPVSELHSDEQQGETGK